jgi:cardiolipin synthase
VYLLVDGYASTISKELEKQLSDAGVHFREFEPIFRGKNYYFGRRLHHKVAVADNYFSLTGGLNIADRYNDVDNIPAWLDYALYVEGETSFELASICCGLWNYTSARPKIFPRSVETAATEIPEDEKCSVRVRRNDWVRRKNQVWRSYFNLFNHADDEIIIMCSYFLPGLIYRNRMARAARKGVIIKVIVAGPSDIPVAKYAERYLYRWMLRNNIEVYEYQETVLHAKIAEHDGRWMTIGSYNVNNISAYASIELNLDVRNKPFVKNVQEELLKVIEADCVRITPEIHNKSTNFFKNFLNLCAYEFIKIVLYLFTFYFKREE